MTPAIAEFISELRRAPPDTTFDGVRADDWANIMAQSLAAIDLEGDGNPHAAALFAAVQWILDEPRTAAEQAQAIHKLFAAPRGKVHIPSLREFVGW